MTTSTNISLLAQSMAQTSRLNNLRGTMDDLQRQVTTLKKHENFSGFGTDSLAVQRIRNLKTMTDSYLHNIDNTANRMDMMSKVMVQLSKIGGQMVSSLSTTDPTNLASIKQLAQQNLGFVKDLVNQNFDGRYLFSGSDITSEPFIDTSALNTNFATQVNTWLFDAAPTADATLFTATDGFTATQLGLSPGLSTAGPVTAHIDKGLDLDYTVKADNAGFQDLIRGLAFLANMQIPDPTAGHVATTAQLQNVLSHISTVLSTSVQEVNDTNQSLIISYNQIKSVKDNHISDKAIFAAQIDQYENADPNSAIISMQALQTQLSASYQVTRIASQMSLVNFM